MEISVIIPTYRPKSYLEECLLSLSRQTMSKSDFEIIIILNGCNHPYHENILKYAHDKLDGCNVSIYQTDIPGVSNARNMGIDKACGRFIVFIDDDDYVSSSYLQELYEIVQCGNVPISNVIAFEDTTKHVVDYFVSRIFHKLECHAKVPVMQARSYMSIPVAKMLSIDIIRSIRFNTHIKNGEDSLFMLQISDMIDCLVPTSSDAVYYRRIRADSAAFKKRSLKERSINGGHLLAGYMICLVQPWRYNFAFVLTRIAALFLKRGK